MPSEFGVPEGLFEPVQAKVIDGVQPMRGTARGQALVVVHHDDGVVPGRRPHRVDGEQVVG